MVSGMIPGLVLLRELEVFVKLFWITETKFVMECATRGLNGMAMEMSGAKYELGGVPITMNISLTESAPGIVNRQANFEH